MTENIKKTEAFIKEKFLSEGNSDRYDWQYRYEHSIRVAGIGQSIAKEEGLDEEALIIACLLHDIGYIVCHSNEDHRIHGRFSAQIAHDFLTSIGFETERINTICYGIKIHTELKKEYERMPTPFEMSIADADDIDRFDAYRLYSSLHSIKLEEMSPVQILECIEQNRERFERQAMRERGTKTATSLWRDRIGFQIDYYYRLKKQMEEMQTFYSEITEVKGD
jgi:uncharacterized protein